MSDTRDVEQQARSLAVARAIDPEAWQDGPPIPTRADTEAFYRRRQQSVEVADRYIANLRAAGYAIVPVKPAEDQVNEGLRCVSVGGWDYLGMERAYRAMIAARPGGGDHE